MDVDALLITREDSSRSFKGWLSYKLCFMADQSCKTEGVNEDFT